MLSVMMMGAVRAWTGEAAQSCPPRLCWMMLPEDSMKVLGCSPEGLILLHAAIVGQCQSAAAATWTAAFCLSCIACTRGLTSCAL